jgi:hypothetical protein
VKKYSPNTDSRQMDLSSPQASPSEQAFARRKILWAAHDADIATRISPTTDYKRLIWNVAFGIGARGLNEQFMLDKEIEVAQRILSWLEDNPHLYYYRDYIKAIPYQEYMVLEVTNTLHWNLWKNTNASLWLSTRDASGPGDQLWQLAVMRTSCWLNTGAFSEVSQ